MNLDNDSNKNNPQTYIEVDLKNIRYNVNYAKSLLQSSTKLLCMIKADAYGTDAKKMSTFLETINVDYFGVAYLNEGVMLRENGIKTPILVMNCDENTFPEIIENNLEPAIFSINQLENFIKELTRYSIENYPIHIKIETGMNRLGFDDNDISSLIKLVKNQSEVNIKSVYSHLAEADVENSEYTQRQIHQFDILSQEIQSKFNYSIVRHILNSEGIYNYTHAQFDMVRLGIGMYGVLGNDNLKSTISWYSSVSQVKIIHQGDSVGYGRAFIAEKETKIAIIALGYADGFRRMLGHGVGGVYIDDNYCPTVGNVCMDMIMVDVTSIEAKSGDKVEIVGRNQSMLDLAQKLKTIPYEVMTTFSARMRRIFID